MVEPRNRSRSNSRLPGSSTWWNRLSAEKRAQIFMHAVAAPDITGVCAVLHQQTLERKGLFPECFLLVGQRAA